MLEVCQCGGIEEEDIATGLALESILLSTNISPAESQYEDETTMYISASLVNGSLTSQTASWLQHGMTGLRFLPS